MDEFELKKELYFRELDRRQELNEAINTPVLILTLIVSIQVFVYSQSAEVPHLLYKFMIGISALSLLAIVYSLVYLLISFIDLNKFHSYGYDYIAPMDEQMVYLRELVIEEGEAQAKVTWENHLHERLSACSTINFETNTKRSESLANAKKGIVIAIILTTIFSILFVSSFIDKLL